MRKQDLFNHVLDYFQRTMDATETELDYGTTFQLLTAVVLSAEDDNNEENWEFEGFMTDDFWNAGEV